MSSDNESLGASSADSLKSDAFSRLGRALGGLNLGAASENEGATSVLNNAGSAREVPENTAGSFVERSLPVNNASAEEVYSEQAEPTVVAAAPVAAPIKATTKGIGDLQKNIKTDIESKVIDKIADGSLNLNEKQQKALLAIPTEIRAPLASLYQRKRNGYEKLANKYVEMIGKYLEKSGKANKPLVEEQKKMLGIEISKATEKRKTAKAVGATAAAVAAPVPSKVKTKTKKNLLRNNNAAAGAPKATAAVSKKPVSATKVDHKAALSAALGYEAPKFFIEKYLKTLEKYGGKTKKVPHEKFAKYCGLFADRKTRKNKGTTKARSAAASAASKASSKSVSI